MGSERGLTNRAGTQKGQTLKTKQWIDVTCLEGIDLGWRDCSCEHPLAP
jgi:hypothetical protein